MELAAKGQLGTYANLNGGSNVGDKLDAHELVRHEALVQAGCTSKFSKTIPLEGSGLNVPAENTESEVTPKIMIYRLLIQTAKVQ